MMQGTRAKKTFSFVTPRHCLFTLVVLMSSFVMFFSTQARTDAATTGTIVTHQVVGPDIPVGQKGTLTVACASGEQLLSGGFYGYAFEQAAYIVESYPSAAN